MTAPDVAAASGAVPPFPVTPLSLPGLSSCLEEGRLLTGGTPVPVSLCDLDALRLVEHAVARKRSILLCPPDPLTPLVSLIPAAAHMASLIAGYRELGLSAGSNLHIAVVTSDYHLRGSYRSVAIRPRPGLMAEPMRAVVPAGVLGTAGNVQVLDASDRGWATVFVRTIGDLRRVGPVDLVVADLPIADPDRLTNLPMPVVLVARDPADPITQQLSRAMPAFGWPPSTAIPDGAPAALRMANREAGVVEIVAVEAPSISENAALFWDDIGPLCRVARLGLGRELAREAFALFHDMLGLAIPVDAYERADGSSLAVRVSALGRACGLLDRGQLRDLYVPMAEAELAALAEAVRTTDAKPVVLARLLAEALDDRQDVVLVTRTAQLARVYSTHLSESGLDRVRVCSLGELIDTPPADVAVLTGMAPTWGRWIYRAGIARVVRVLAYTRGEGSDGRFDEAEVVRRAIAEQRDAETRLNATERRSWSWRQLNSPSDDPPPDTATRAWTEPVRIAAAPPPPEAPAGLWEDGHWLANVEPDSGSGERPIAGPVDRLVPGVRVDLTDGTRVLLAADAPVSRWRATARRVEQVPASELRVADQLIFLDDDAHKNLIAKVLEVAESVPALAVASAWLQHWRTVLLAAYRDAGSYNRLWERLAEQGCRVQSQTVRLWVIGETLGPEDPEDVHRLALVTSDPVLTSAHAEVYRAIRTLRGAHVRLGRRLADITRRIGPVAASGAMSRDELVDAASGITAADVESAVTLATVRALITVGAVPAVLTGRRITGEDLPA